MRPPTARSIPSSYSHLLNVYHDEGKSSLKDYSLLSRSLFSCPCLYEPRSQRSRQDDPRVGGATVVTREKDGIQEELLLTEKKQHSLQSLAISHKRNEDETREGRQERLSGWTVISVFWSSRCRRRCSRTRNAQRVVQNLRRRTDEEQTFNRHQLSSCTTRTPDSVTLLTSLSQFAGLFSLSRLINIQLPPTLCTLCSHPCFQSLFPIHSRISGRVTRSFIRSGSRFRQSKGKEDRNQISCLVTVSA